MAGIGVKEDYIKNDIGERESKWKRKKSSREDELDDEAKREEAASSVWTYPNYTKTFSLTVIQSVPVLSVDILCNMFSLSYASA
jgi:hypothetical protein